MEDSGNPRQRPAASARMRRERQRRTEARLRRILVQDAAALAAHRGGPRGDAAHRLGERLELAHDGALALTERGDLPGVLLERPEHAAQLGRLALARRRPGGAPGERPTIKAGNYGQVKIETKTGKQKDAPVTRSRGSPRRENYSTGEPHMSFLDSWILLGHGNIARTNILQGD